MEIYIYIYGIDFNKMKSGYIKIKLETLYPPNTYKISDCNSATLPYFHTCPKRF